MKQLFKDVISLKQPLTTIDYLQSPQSVIIIKERLQQLLQTTLENPHPKVAAFLKQLQKHQESIFTFLDFEKVPYDNNSSERAIRNIKVKTKVSSPFRTIEGATQFAIIISVVDTAIKNQQNIFDALMAIANFIPE